MGYGNKKKPPISRTIVNIAGLLIFSTSSKVGRIHLRPSSLDSRPDAWRHRRASSGYILGYSHRCCPYWPCVNDELTKLYICTVPTVHFITSTTHCFTIIIETGKYVQETCRPTTFGCNHSTQISMWQRLFLKLKGICFY